MSTHSLGKNAYRTEAVEAVYEALKGSQKPEISKLTIEYIIIQYEKLLSEYMGTDHIVKYQWLLPHVGVFYNKKMSPKLLNEDLYKMKFSLFMNITFNGVFKQLL